MQVLMEGMWWKPTATDEGRRVGMNKFEKR